MGRPRIAPHMTPACALIVRDEDCSARMLRSSRCLRRTRPLPRSRLQTRATDEPDVGPGLVHVAWWAGGRTRARIASSLVLAQSRTAGGTSRTRWAASWLAGGRVVHLARRAPSRISRWSGRHAARRRAVASVRPDVDERHPRDSRARSTLRTPRARPRVPPRGPSRDSPCPPLGRRTTRRRARGCSTSTLTIRRSRRAPVDDELPSCPHGAATPQGSSRTLHPARGHDGVGANTGKRGGPEPASIFPRPAGVGDHRASGP